MSLALSGKGLLFSLLFVGLASQETGLIKELDHSYSLAKSSDDLYTLESLVKKSLKTFPESDKLFWRLGRVYFKLGETFTSESEKIYFFSLCMAQTKKTIEINSQSANGYFYNGLCSGTLGQTQGIWSSLGIIEPFKKDMETAINLDPSIGEGGPHRALGNLYLKLPYVLGGDLERSIGHFQKAIQLGSEFGENYLGLAEAYIENGDFVLAKGILHTLLNMKLSSQKEESVLEWKTQALDFLGKIQN
jgi:tetratricopeptide (TPR) repeat protein